MASDIQSSFKVVVNYASIDQTEKPMKKSSSNVEFHTIAQKYDREFLKEVILFWIPLLILFLSIGFPFALIKVRENMARNVQEYINPCNFSNILSNEKLEKLKIDIDNNLKPMEAIKIIDDDQILPKKNLNMKLENMTYISKNLQEQYDFQKRHRFNCYQLNMCKTYYNFTNIAFYIYFGNVTLTIILLLFYITNTRHRVGSDEPLFIKIGFLSFSGFVVCFHVFFYVFFFKFDTPCESYFDEHF